MYENIPELTGNERLESDTAIKRTYGTVAMEIDQVLKRWEEYTVELFYDERGDKPEINGEMKGQTILNEIKNTMRKLKNGKDAVEDKIIVEMLEAVVELATKEIKSSK